MSPRQIEPDHARGYQPDSLVRKKKASKTQKASKAQQAWSQKFASFEVEPLTQRAQKKFADKLAGTTSNQWVVGASVAGTNANSLHSVANEKVSDCTTAP